MGLIYELGIQVQYQEIPTEYFSEVQQSMHKLKHDISPQWEGYKIYNA